MERDQQRKRTENHSNPQVLSFAGIQWMGHGGHRRTPSPIFSFLRHPLLHSPQLDFLHINHLSHFEISRSGYYSSIVNDTISQGIN